MSQHFRNALCFVHFIMLQSTLREEILPSFKIHFPFPAKVRSWLKKSENHKENSKVRLSICFFSFTHIVDLWVYFCLQMLAK